MCVWMPTGLPSLSSMKSIAGNFTSTGLLFSRISNFSLPLLPTTCSGGMPYTFSVHGAYELDATARDDEGLEAAFSQVGEQFEHGLVDHFRERSLGHGMLRGGDPILHDLVELVGGHARVRNHNDLPDGRFAAGERAFH